MPTNRFVGTAQTPSDPAQTVFEITPSDTTDLAQATLALNVATPGTLRVTTLDGTVADITIEAGVYFPLRTVRVWATGTTATGVRGLT